MSANGRVRPCSCPTGVRPGRGGMSLVPAVGADEAAEMASLAPIIPTDGVSPRTIRGRKNARFCGSMG
jgi:hypothetical protein